MDKQMISPVRQIVADAGLEAPDGRPLHRYPVTPEQVSSLRSLVRQRFLTGSPETAAASFVFWAAEHFRENFPDGSYRRWEFVWSGLGLRGDDNIGRSLVEPGLSWWRRSVRQSEAGQKMHVYSLLAEGGVPQSLLVHATLYQRVLLGLVADLEIEGIQAPALAERIAARWVGMLPQTFQTDEFIRLLAELALALTGLRALLPEDLSGQAAQSWLDRNRPGWADELPLRMSPQVAEQLIRPVLGSAREQAPVGGPLAARELRQDSSGHWHWFLRLQEEGFVPAALLPGATRDLRLRLVPLGAPAALPDAPVYAAAPDQQGWRVRRIGRAGPALLPLGPELPFVLGAFADGNAMGEVIVAPGLNEVAEAPSLWRAADPTEGEAATRLVPQPGLGRTRAACLWLMASKADQVFAEGDTLLAGPFAAEGGAVWRASGRGTVHVGSTHRFRVETAAATEATEARLLAVGPILRTWRTEREGDVIYLGSPRILGEIGSSGLREVPAKALRCWASTSRRLGQQNLEWIERGEVVARVRLICLPATLHLTISETGPRQVRLIAEGLPHGTRLTLRADRDEERTTVEGGRGELLLTTKGTPVGQIHLRMADIDAGTALELVAPWPARAGLILDPDGQCLGRDQPIAAEALRGWRGVVPEGARADLTLSLWDHRQVALRVTGEVPFYQYVPLIRALLAQGGPDAQVNLNLVVKGQEGRRLEVRRYHDHAIVEDDRLWAGLPRDTRAAPQTALAEQLDQQLISMHAVDLSAPAIPRIIVDASTRNLRTLLGEGGGPWLVQARLQGRVQRAVAWSPSPMLHSTRDSRIARYEDEARAMLAQPESEHWNQLLRLIASVSQGGDAGVADQVQALARTPVAVVTLILRASRGDLADILLLDSASPMFWPILPVASFVEAIRTECARRQRGLVNAGFDHSEARDGAELFLKRRIGEVLATHPELEGHFCAALFQADLGYVAGDLVNGGTLALVPNPPEQLRELAQVAARRFDRLPTGIGRIEPLRRPDGLAGFNPYLQPVIDAPLLATEFAMEQRPPASTGEVVALINLRLVDPLYFDAALPAAIAFALNGPR